MKKLLVVLSIVLFSNLSHLHAALILVYEDSTQGTSVLPGALGLLGLSATTAASQADFNAQLTSGVLWDLVIFAEQLSFTFSDSREELTDYVNGGGRMIGFTWKSNSGLCSLLEASSVDTNCNEITPQAHPLFAGFFGPIGLSNPGWVTFSRSWEPTGAAIGYGTLGGGHAAILGNSGRTLLYGPLTDAYADIAEGQQLAANGIQFLLIPEPATVGLLALGGLLARRRNRA